VSGCQGVWKILRFNWPWYAGAVAVTALAAVLLAGDALGAPWGAAAVVSLLLADLWLLASLVVSHVVYDRSAVARGEWLGAPPTGPVVVCHLGQDEAAAALAKHWAAVPCRTFDLHDARRTGSPSLRRARAELRRGGAAAAVPAPLDALPLADGSAAVVVVAFAAHEVRDAALRAAMFRELRRVAGSAGRVLVVEHLRDGWNLLAYGPGAFHFLARTTWLATFAAAGLELVHESRLTPFVARFELRSSP
jgi:hypothetical protein